MPKWGTAGLLAGFGGGELTAEGVARCWCMLCMQLGGTGTKRLPQASTCLKEKAPGFSSPSPGKATSG